MTTAPPPRAVRHRYGLLLALVLAAVVFYIVTPDTPTTRAIDLLLAGAQLSLVIVTAGGRPVTRGWLTAVVVVIAVALAIVLVTDLVPEWVAPACLAALTIAIMIELTRGALRLLRAQGVTLHVVAAALTLYLMLGFLFALVVGIVVHTSSTPYFASGTDGTQSQHVYFSFTTITTTGYGDLTPATGFGRAMAVLEMLLGQIYLVTVIGLLVSNLRRAPRPAS